MNKWLSVFFCVVIIAGCVSTEKTSGVHTVPIPASIKGDFTDDYGIRYTITDSLWIQHPGIKYHLLEYNEKEKFFIARNDANNPSEANLYSRIDFMFFENMAPYGWGFCLTTYNSKTAEEARKAISAERANPRKGCGGFPFSRMKK